MISVCPNKNLPEWKLLESVVGRFEAFRDFMETNGEIRTPEAVKEKIALRDNPQSFPGFVPNSLIELANYENTVPESLDVDTINRVIAIEFANKLSRGLGVDYQIVTPIEAEALTKDAENPWKGERAFFIGGRVYFVGDHLSTTIVLHEFAHPLVRAIMMENPDLFNNLLQQIIETPEGKEILEEVGRLYPETAIDSNQFKEEVVVRAIERSGKDKMAKTQGSKGFVKALENLLYNLKQMLRRIFGKTVNVSKMDENTTVKELATMLMEGGKFEIDMDVINQNDVVAYVREQEAYINDLMKVNNTEIQALINRVYDISNKHIDTLLSRKEYDELAAILTDEFKRGDLQEMKSRLGEYQSAVANMAEKTKDDMEYTRKKVTALVDTLFRLEVVLDKMLLHMQDIAKSEDTVDNLHKAYYYDYLVKHWEGFIKEANEAMDDPMNGVPNNSPVAQLVSNMTRTASRIKALTNEMYANGARDTLYQELEPIHDSIKERYTSMIKALKEKGGSQAKIDQLHREYYGITEGQYNRLKELQKMRAAGTLGANRNELEKLEKDLASGIAITPEKIELLLKGEMGDSNFFNSYLEGYLYNTDPIIGGLALYTKNKMNEVMAVAQAKFNDFAKDIQPLLQTAGYNPRNIGELGQKIGFIDKISKRDESGVLVEKQVWTLLNPFKNYRYDYDAHKDAVDKAQLEYSATGSDEARKELVDAIAARQAFLRKYFNQEYIPEFYEREAIFEQDDAGKEASFRRKNIFERMRMLTEPATTQSDYMEIAGELDELWREYRQMHSLYDLNGKKKTGDELEISKRMRQYRDASKEFYEWKPRKGVFDNALLAYEQELVDKGIEQGSEEYKILRGEWLKRNTRIVIKDSYYERRQNIIDQISEIMAKLPESERKNMDQTLIWNDIHDLTGGFRDDNGQPNGSEMSEGSISKVKELQLVLEDMKKNVVSRNGLTRAENDRLRELHDLRDGRALTPDEVQEMRDLYNKRNTHGLNKADVAILDGLYQELAELSKREATEYYTDVMNNWLSQLNTDKLFLNIGSRTITRLGADAILDPAVINELLRQDTEFAKWFRDNHIEKDVYNKESQTVEKKWERLYIWSVVRPQDKTYMENYSDDIQGMPSLNFYARVVKPEYRTKKIIGVTVDNKGNWLPKTMEQGAADDRYINQEYYDLKKKDPNMAEVLSKITEHHLKNQEGLGYKSRLYLDFPRFRKSNLEVIQSKGLKNMGREKANALTIWAKRVKNFFYGAKDDSDSGFNYKDEFNLVRADMFDNEITSVPIAGLYDIDIDDVSTDITHSMMRYMLSGERQKQLVKISPMVRAIQAVVNDPKNGVKELNKINKFNFIHRGVKTYLTKKGKSVRQSAVNNFIEREFEGQTMTGYTKDIPWLNNTASLLFKRASFGFFALNIPSALKNSMGAKFQALVEASAGNNIDHPSLQQGNLWAYATMGELSFKGQLYEGGPKSINQQVVELFDPVQGRFEEKFGESMSRTMAKDVASMSWLYNFRKWVELQASLQIFGGMMYYKKDIEQTQSDGTVKKIAYMDAWETRDGKIQLKAGIDPKWGVTYDKDGEMKVGKEFTAFRNKVHQTMNNLQGAYAKFDQPEAQRYIAFRFLSYLRRYFTTMMVNRYGFSGPIWDPKPRFNPGAGEMQMGYYIRFLKFMKETTLSLGRNLPYMTPEEKAASLKVVTEVGMLVAANVLMGLIFGWDPDDDDKYAKLREKSDALQLFPLTEDDPDRAFSPMGFVSNHSLFLLMNIRAENEQFLPMPGFGLDDFSAMLDLKSIAFGPTLQTYGQLFDDAVNILQGDDAAYYQREVGPYKWQQEGGSKFWAHLTSTFGLTGSSLDPAKAIKGFQSVQSRAR